MVMGLMSISRTGHPSAVGQGLNMLLGSWAPTSSTACLERRELPIGRSSATTKSLTYVALISAQIVGQLPSG